ncbi:MAG: O-antigen ligase family protein [Steroidobacteraceae bacterium]
MALYLSLGAVGFLVFLLLQPKVKALISFFLMMNFFNIAPNKVLDVYAWDYGAILMLVTAAELFFRQPALEPRDHTYLTVLKVFLAWLFICFSWSLLVYRYPIMHTIKSARYMVVGYSMTLIFIRLFSVQTDAFEFLMKWFYRLTFLLMPVFVLQYLTKTPLLFTQIGDYEGALRAIPGFLPLCLLNFWIILARFLSSERLAVHEWIYAALVLVTVALTYTRGIYLAFIFTGGVLLFTMSRDRTLKASSVFGAALAAIVVIAVLVASGVAGKVVGRAANGLQILESTSPTSGHREDDTFTGRLGLAAERFSLVWDQNPIVGYGFLHEEDVPADLRNHLRYGTPLGGTAADPTAFSRYDADGHYTLGFYTADIAWANIVITTGCVGVALLIALMLTFVFEHYGNVDGMHPLGYAVRTGLFLQVVMIFLLMFDGDSFYGNLQIPAFLLAGYSLAREHRVRAKSALTVMQTRPPNLMT